MKVHSEKVLREKHQELLQDEKLVSDFQKKIQKVKQLKEALKSQNPEKVESYDGNKKIDFSVYPEKTLAETVENLELQVERMTSKLQTILEKYDLDISADSSIRDVITGYEKLWEEYKTAKTTLNKAKTEVGLENPDGKLSIDTDENFELDLNDEDFSDVKEVLTETVVSGRESIKSDAEKRVKNLETSMEKLVGTLNDE